MSCWRHFRQIRQKGNLSFFRDSKVPLIHNKHGQLPYIVLAEKQFTSLASSPQACTGSNRHIQVCSMPVHMSRNIIFPIRPSEQEHNLFCLSSCQFSTSQVCRWGQEQTDKEGKDSKVTTSTGIFQRFKDAYREYGKVLVTVHVATSVVWYGSFVYVAASGLDVVPWLQKMGAGETLIKPFQSGAGNFAVAYLLYKLATPARYTVTIAGTRLAVRTLRKWGYMEQRSPEDSIRNLMKDSRSQMKTKYEEKKVDMKEKVGDLKEEMKSRRKGKEL